MQIRPHTTDSGYRVWLNRSEQESIADYWSGSNAERELAVLLGLHGLRSEEITNVRIGDFRALDENGERFKLSIPFAKRGARECPISVTVYDTARVFRSAASIRKDEPLIDRTTAALRNWIQEARENLADSAEGRNEDLWSHVSMHDLRRSWATDTFYTLAFAGVPIAEELTMGWGGWKMNQNGRATFRENYLGPEPDHIARQAIDRLPIA